MDDKYKDLMKVLSDAGNKDSDKIAEALFLANEIIEYNKELIKMIETTPTTSLGGLMFYGQMKALEMEEKIKQFRKNKGSKND